MTYSTSVETRSLYVHWPFCPYKCHFCPFVALAGHDPYMQSYHSALVKEIELYARACPIKQSIETIFLGGGTPSTYPDDLLLDTFGRLRNVFHLQDLNEVTIEVNPGTVRIEQLAVWKAAGINRLSIGVQSLNDKVLQTLNRRQTQEQVRWLLEQASQEFDNISIDMIVGLPGVTPAEWKEMMADVVTWPIKHISMYFLTVHEDTPLYFRVKTQRVSLPPDGDVVDTYQWSIEFLRQHGFEHYEISNFAKPGYQSKHNSVYWHRKPYKAFGIGACSFDGSTRFQNESNIKKYIAAIEQEQDVTVVAETLTPEQVCIERLMLGLRQTRGIALAELCDMVGPEKQGATLAKAKTLSEQGFLAFDNGRIKVTPRGLAVQNEITVQLS